MNKHTLITKIFFLGTILLSACARSTTPANFALEDRPALSPCTAKDTLFETIEFDNLSPLYHEIVNTVINAHTKNYSKGSGDQTFANFQCKAKDLKGVLRPTAELYVIAGNLYPWHVTKNPDNLKNLSEADMSVVLLELLRTYECSFREYESFLSINIQKEYDAGKNPCEIPSGYPNLPQPALAICESQRKRIIEDEKIISRKALERTLTLIGGIDRLRPLAVDLECFQRASLDLRNVLGLVAETASCMPRIWDARGSLRDSPP